MQESRNAARARITGTFEKLLFHRDGFSIFRMKLDDGTFASVKGEVPKSMLRDGKNMNFEGDWKFNPKFGPTFAIAGSPKSMSPDGSGVVRYLSLYPISPRRGPWPYMNA